MAAVGGAAQKKLLPATDVYLLPSAGAWSPTPRTLRTLGCAPPHGFVYSLSGARVYSVSTLYLFSIYTVYLYTVYLHCVSKSISGHCIVPAPRAGPHTT